MRKLLERLLMILITYIALKEETPLPVGMTEFQAWSDSIIALSGEYADIDSMKYALATMVMHADAKHGALPREYFVSRLRKVAANQVASQVFQDIKQKQADAAAAKQATEDTVAKVESSDAQPKENLN